MKIAVALLTCDRYDYTVQTVESFLSHNNPDDFLLFHGDDASTDRRVVEYVQSKGFQTVVQHTERKGCSPTTDALLHAVAEHVDPGTLVLYLQNDWTCQRPLPQKQLQTLLARQDVAFVQLSSSPPRSRYARNMQWAFENGEPWEYGNTSHEVIYSGFNRGMGYPPGIGAIETWLPAMKGVTKERRFRARTEYPDRKMCRLTRPVFVHGGSLKTPNGMFGTARKNRKAARGVATIGVAAPAYGVSQEVVDRFVSQLPDDIHTAIHVRPLAGTFNLARAKNRVIRELLDKCDIVVATDIDCLIPPGLLESLSSQVKDGVSMWNPARNVHELNGNSWKEWQSLPLRKSGKGSFIAMTSSDWRKTGGFDERYCYGWGKEDNAFLSRRRAVGIRTTRLDYPLVHIMHPNRQWKGSKRSRRGRPHIPDDYTVNYLTGRLPRTKGIVAWVTSACPLSCENCNQRDLMQSDPSYHMTIDEVELLCQCADASDEPLGRLDITGGEPLSWKYMRECITRMNKCSAFSGIRLFTSGMGKDDDLVWLSDNVDQIRLSWHPNNERRVKALRRQLPGCRARIRIADKREHIPIPDEPVPNSLPGRCRCPFVCYTRGLVYVCPNIGALLAQHGQDWRVSPGIVEPIGPNFVDIRRHLGRTGANISWCALCVGNNRVARTMVGQGA